MIFNTLTHAVVFTRLYTSRWGAKDVNQVTWSKGRNAWLSKESHASSCLLMDTYKKEPPRLLHMSVYALHLDFRRLLGAIKRLFKTAGR